MIKKQHGLGNKFAKKGGKPKKRESNKTYKLKEAPRPNGKSKPKPKPRFQPAPKIKPQINQPSKAQMKLQPKPQSKPKPKNNHKTEVWRFEVSKSVPKKAPVSKNTDIKPLAGRVNVVILDMTWSEMAYWIQARTKLTNLMYNAPGKVVTG